MKERPIIFSAPMVRAILDGRKTQRKLYVRGGEDPTAPDHIARRLMNGIVEINGHGCWIWGRAISAGYGTMTVSRKTVRVHRLALALALGRDETGLEEVCHDCPGGDNPLCVNPGHLFEGTHGDNVRDAVAKGRARAPVGPVRHGSANPASKLSDAQVVELRAMLVRGERQRVIAERFGISQSAVSLIALGKVRRHA